ncbi:MAG: substrate-binding domain-containing protein [Rhodospirillales bacterium]|jgi:ribose transport system substrate-binding protein|nr:hypothetical protein [Rhodospirillaceae bacterium]MDP6427776.1 substrate-binding domain-containing protein [Rhodospirillales bacterium]MDP6644590.1 substrate-binding domain-containing protein [Rhodospirillales bacterium]MDP6840276.1 substrate-binding domain-containing protein [Rhodospirillales bacterium]|tara:strand:+ start:2441 stop:3370 length:930 start_codon:yes stop_codon:yes gene_type:complete
MKKLLALIIGLAAILAASPAVQAAGKTIGVALASDTNPFYIVMRKGIEIQARKLGWKIRVVTANEDVNKQVNGVMDLVAQKVDGILISPIDAIATGAAYKSAHDAGIPIISIARGSKSKYQTLFVAMDSKLIGRDIGQWAAGKAGGKGKIAMISGPAGANVFKDLADGFKESMGKQSGMKIVYEQTGALTRERGLNQAEDILVAHPDVRVIYAGNDEIAMGAGQAVATAGKKANVIITGLNGVPPALKAVIKGSIDMTVVVSPMVWGKLGVNIMNDWLSGKKHEQKVFIKHIIATKGNAAKYLPPKRKK